MSIERQPRERRPVRIFARCCTENCSNPATVVVHWITGPQNMCATCAVKACNIGSALGLEVPTSALTLDERLTAYAGSRPHSVTVDVLEVKQCYIGKNHVGTVFKYFNRSDAVPADFELNAAVFRTYTEADAWLRLLVTNPTEASSFLDTHSITPL